MDDEERAEFEAMRAREAEMEAHFMEAQQRMEQSQAALREQQAATARMQAEWEAMRAEVRRPSSWCSNRTHLSAQGSAASVLCVTAATAALLPCFPSSFFSTHAGQLFICFTQGQQQARKAMK